MEEKRMVAEYRQKSGCPLQSYDSISHDIDRTLSQFTVKKTYMGYPFLVSAIREAVIALPERLTTTEMCELVAADEKTAPQVVSRELKRMVSSIWNHANSPEIYDNIAGFHVSTKPLPLDFVYTMAEHLA